MAKIKITVELDPYELYKESQEQRKERVRNSKPMGTRVQQKKKAYKRHEKHKRKYTEEY